MVPNVAAGHPMNLDFNMMTPEEASFVKAYAIALNREYDVFVTALHLMRAEDSGVRCSVRATELAWKLRELHADFESELTATAIAHSMKSGRQLAPFPALDDLARVIRVSFFKLIEPGGMHQKPNDKGWFSGHPLDWQDSWKKSYHAPPKTADHPLTAILNAFLKLFEPPSNYYNPKDLPWYGKSPYKDFADYDDNEEEYDDE